MAMGRPFLPETLVILYCCSLYAPTVQPLQARGATLVNITDADLAGVTRKSWTVDWAACTD